MKRRITIINEEARKALHIDRDEYALCAYLHYRQEHPRQKIAGYCCDSFEEIADFVGISKRALITMFHRLAARKLVEQSFRGGHYRASSLFIDADSLVNKLHQSGEETSPIAVKKLHQERIRERGSETRAREIEISVSLETEKKSPIPPVPAAPPSPIGYNDYPRYNSPTDVEEALRRFYADYPHEWTAGVLDRAKASRYSDTQQKEIVSKFASFAVEKFQVRTYGQLNARLQRWFLDQPAMITPKDTTAPTAKHKGGPVWYDNNRPALEEKQLF